MTMAAPVITREDVPDLEMLAKFPLVESDGEPLETGWHVFEIYLLIQSVLSHFADRTDFYAGGNMFIYFSLEQARNRDFRGPDFFIVKETHLSPLRRYWATWLEGGRYPNLIMELLSPTTADYDRTIKKDVYERVFGTAEYILYDPDTGQLEGWQLGAKKRYVKMKPDERGWLWSDELGLWIGIWEGEYNRFHSTWVRFFDANGQLVLIGEEHAQAERRRAEIERQRAEAAEAELARLKSQLAQQAKTANDQASAAE
jgi:Uma2 family endonuclease